MEFIVKDKGGDWCFDGVKTYWCLDKDKNPVGKIYGEYIPDPIKLWQNKCEAAGIKTTDKAAAVLRSSQVVTKLWEHYYANSNN